MDRDYLEFPAWLRRAVLLGGPVALGILLLFHATDLDPVFESLRGETDRWLTVHVLHCRSSGC